MSEAAQIYIELGSVGAEKYAELIREEDYLLSQLREIGRIDNQELTRVRNELYQLRQDARLVSNR
jgi:DNA-directed RNA polymerase subunit F